MPVFKGSTKVAKISFGSKTVKKIYYGDKLVFGKETQFVRLLSTDNLSEYTIPNRLVGMKVVCVGGGGRGGNGTVFSGSYAYSGSGGGSGGCAIKVFSKEECELLNGTTVQIHVGGPSEDSTFTSVVSTITAFAGKNGVSQGNVAGGVGGDAENGDVNISGKQGTTSGWYSAAPGGPSVYKDNFGKGGDGGVGYGTGAAGNAGVIELWFEY